MRQGKLMRKGVAYNPITCSRGVTVRAALWALVVLGLLGLGLYWQVSEMSESAAVPIMRSELRSIASVQEEYFDQYQRYGQLDDLEEQGYILPPKMSVVSVETSAQNWRIVVGHRGSPVQCEGRHRSNAGLDVRCFRPGDQEAGPSSRARADTPEVLPDPNPRFSYQPSRPEVGDTVFFDASASLDAGGPIKKWVWNLGNEVYKRGMQTHTRYGEPGKYTVRLFVTGENGETRQKVQRVRVLPPSGN